MRLWLVREEPLHSVRLDEVLMAHDIDITNGLQISEAMREFNLSLPGNSPWPDALPENFPIASLKLPVSDFSPDFIVLEHRWFMSAKLLAAMALPDWVADIRPIDLVAGGAEARAKDYHFVRVRAFADAIDFAASDARLSKFRSAKTGAMITSVDWLSRIRIREGFKPTADLFEDATAQTRCFATDALAERVLAAGCTGIAFVHPQWFAEPDGDAVIRTAAGIERMCWDDDHETYHTDPITAEEADAGPRAAAAEGLADYL